MVRLAVVGEAEGTNVAFSVKQDGPDVNVMADGDLVGWFEVQDNGKISFVASYPDDKNSFNFNEDGLLTTIS